MRKATLTLSFIILFSVNLLSQIPFNLNKEIIDSETLAAICDDELRWLRNEIYARHGYVFSNKECKLHFEQTDWYTPQSSNKNIKLSEVEKSNAFILKKEEIKRNARTKAITSFLENLKAEKYDEKAYIPDSIIINTLKKVNIYELKFCGNAFTLVNHEEKALDPDLKSKERFIFRSFYSISIKENTITIGRSQEIFIPDGTGESGFISPRCIYFEYNIDNKNRITLLPHIIFVVKPKNKLLVSYTVIITVSHDPITF